MTISDQSDQIARNRNRQAELYGEPLGERFRRIADTLGMTQARIAETVGLSPAMLSQLIGGRRIKIGNPAVVQRIQALEELVLETGSTGVDLESRLTDIRASTGSATRTTTITGAVRTSDPAAVVRGMQDVLRSAASAEDLLDVARSLQEDHPRLAEVLRVYGTGRTDDAVAHYEKNAG